MKSKKKIYNYGIDVDKETLEQFKNCYSEDFVVSAALMPDAHLGYAAPIGAVLKTKNFVVPAWVGFDIGCGLIAVRIKGKNLVEKTKKKRDDIYKKVMNRIPMGVGRYNKNGKVSEKTRKEFEKLLEKFQKKPYDKGILNYLKTTAIKHLGTLGAGNHFIELGRQDTPKTKENSSQNFEKAKPPKKEDEKDNELWLIIHSGSRGVGHSVAKKYMIHASGSKSKSDYEKTFPLEAKTKLGGEYLNVLEFGLDYALLNRMEMAYQIVEILERIFGEKLKFEVWVNKNHNHAIYERGYWIHRKGATPAKKGEKGIIPGNMRDGSFLVMGKGSAKFLNSSSHGAGRRMSRKGAREKYTMEDFREAMKGIKGTISEKTIDELPMAYKDVFEVMNAQKDSVKVLKHIRPIINWKGG